MLQEKIFNIKSEKEFNKIVAILTEGEKSLPLFIENEENLYLIPEFEKLALEKTNLILSYLGKEINDEYKAKDDDEIL